jgi:hypothetical protein
MEVAIDEENVNDGIIENATPSSEVTSLHQPVVSEKSVTKEESSALSSETSATFIISDGENSSTFSEVKESLKETAKLPRITTLTLESELANEKEDVHVIKSTEKDIPAKESFVKKATVSLTKKVIQLRGRTAAAVAIIDLTSEDEDNCSTGKSCSPRKKQKVGKDNIFDQGSSSEKRIFGTTVIEIKEPAFKDPTIMEEDTDVPTAITQNNGTSSTDVRLSRVDRPSPFLVDCNSNPPPMLKQGLKPGRSIRVFPSFPPKLSLGQNPPSNTPAQSWASAAFTPTPQLTLVRNTTSRRSPQHFSDKSNKIVAGKSVSIAPSELVAATSLKFSAEMTKLQRNSTRLNQDLLRQKEDLKKKDSEISALKIEIAGLKSECRQSRDSLARINLEKKAMEITIKNNLEQHEKVLEETKRKQWCVSCLKEAIYFCCWNTSYCGYDCQSTHWPVHVNDCQQQQRQKKQSQAITSTSSISNEKTENMT